MDECDFFMRITQNPYNGARETLFCDQRVAKLRSAIIGSATRIFGEALS